MTHRTLAGMACAVASFFSSRIALAQADFMTAVEANDALRITSEAWSTGETFVWLFKGLAIGGSTWLLIQTGKHLQKDAAYDALWTFAGAMIAGISPHIAQTFFYV